MGRIDVAYLAADGRVTALEAHWLPLTVMTVAAIVAYIIASGLVPARRDGEAQRD